MGQSSTIKHRLAALKKACCAGPSPVARLVNGVGSSPELSGLVIDRFEQLAIVHTYSHVWYEARAEIAGILQSLSVTGAVVWNRELDPKLTTRRGAELLFGDVPERYIVGVDGLQLVLKPFKTASGGIFLDTREVRTELLRESAGRRVLNLFCFTGSLGIAAAVGGAREVTQVDISQSVLEWAKENAALQDVTSGVIKYFTDDAADVLERCARRREKGTDSTGFDTIIVDPPAFGATGTKHFDLSQQIEMLLEAALRAATSQFSIYLMCNETGILPGALERYVPSRLVVTQLRAPEDTHPGNISALSVMRGIKISST